MAHFSYGWSYRATITVTPPTLTSALTNYPAMIRLDSDNFDFDNAKADGTDVRFALTDGSAFLSHELVSWEGGSDGHGIFYVLIPSLPIAGLSLYIYFGNEDASDVSAPATVWADYEAVVHMIRDESGDIHESKSGTPLTLIADSGDAYPVSQDGLNHKAEYFDGDQEPSYWKLPDGVIPDLGPSSSEAQAIVTLEVIAKADVEDGVDRPLVAQGNYTDYDFSLFLERYDENIYFVDGSVDTWETSTWAIITAIKKAEGEEDLYCNAYFNDGSGEDNDPADASVYVGGSSGVTIDGSERVFKGWIEEVRIAFSTRTAEWHATLQADLVDNTLIIVGDPSLNPNSGLDHFAMDWNYRFEVVVNALTTSEDPCIVRLTMKSWNLTQDTLENGIDIRFALDGGVDFLPYERESWDANTAEMQFAVRLPSLSEGETIFHLYYQNFFAEEGSNHEEAWAGSVAVKSDATFTALRGPYLNPKAIHYPNFSSGFRYRAPVLITPSESSGFETLYDVLVEIPLNSSCEGEISNYPWWMQRNDSHMYGFGTPKGDGWYPSEPSFYETFPDMTPGCPDLVFKVRIPELPPEGVLVYFYWSVQKDKIWNVISAQPDAPGEGEAIPVDVFYYRYETNPANACTWEGSTGPGLVPVPPTLGEELPEEIPSPPTEMSSQPEEIISASFSYGSYGIATGSLSANYSLSVGDYLNVEDPVTGVVVFSGVVSKVAYNYKTHLYDISLMDPLTALSQGEVLFSESYLSDILNEVVADYGESIVLKCGSIATVRLAPVEFGIVIDPEEEIASDPVDLVELFKTTERATGGFVSFRPGFNYFLEDSTDLGVLTDSQLLNAVTGFKNRYANRVICKASGEWWEDPGAETEAAEWIRGATMIVTRYGDQVRKIRLTTDDLVYEEDYTYDSDFYVTKHEIVITQRILDPLSNYAYFRTSTTREWAITDEATYVYTEEVISEQKLHGASEYMYQDRTVRTITVAEGSVIEESQRYGWNYEDSDWHVLMNDYEITGSGDEISSGDGSYSIIRGFTAQPGLSAYSVKTTYEYYWTDEIAGTYDMRLQKTEVLNSVPSAPGISRVLPLKKYSVSFCVIAEDLDAQAALGIKEYTYTPLCVNDDSSLTTMKAIAENTLAWCGRCRLLSGEVPLSLAEGWVIGDTFSWGGLTWTLENLNHDLKGRRTQITATAEASIAWLKKTLLPETDDLGNGIHGVVRKEAEKVNNIEHVTIVRMIDYETYVVQLDNGEMKIAHLEFGTVGSLPVGASMYVIRESLL